MEYSEDDIKPAIVTNYNLDEEQEKKEIVRKYRALSRALRPKIKKGDKELLRTAFEMAANAHKTMRRKSGEPYIFHPIAVAMICVEEIGLGVRSTICALLHDTVEDTDITLDDIKTQMSGVSDSRNKPILPNPTVTSMFSMFGGCPNGIFCYTASYAPSSGINQWSSPFA